MHVMAGPGSNLVDGRKHAAAGGAPAELVIL
jgi:hypothetical protein